MRKGLTLAERDRQAFLPTYERLPMDVGRAEGAYLYDAEGRRYLDLFGGLAVNALGHRHPSVLSAISDQLGKYAHISNIFLQTPQIELAEHLLRLTGYDRAFFCNSGTEATEAAIKLARRHGAAAGKTELVAFTGGFHGRTMGALSLMTTEKYRDGYGPFLPDCTVLPFNDSAALRAHAHRGICAVILEFLQGEGGIVPADEAFIRTLFALRDELGFLVIADEVQSGLGRTGRFFQFEHAGVRPDVVTVAKALGGGLPLGAILTVEPLADAFGSGRHGTTFGGNPVACAAGAAVLETIERDGLMDAARRIGEDFIAAFRHMQDAHPSLIREVRGRGCMLGVELIREGAPVVRACREEGLLINVTQSMVLRFLPPFILTGEQVAEAVRILDRVFDRIDS